MILPSHRNTYEEENVYFAPIGSVLFVGFEKLLFKINNLATPKGRIDTRNNVT